MELKTLALTPFETNCYVVCDGGEAVVVDPGEESPALERAIAGLQVKYIVNTHGHIDHCGGNAWLKAQTGAPLLCHEEDLILLRNIPQQGMMFGVPGTASPEPDRYLTEGEVLQVGAVALKVLHTPGHSPGHVVLAADGFVIAGDVLFSGSIGRTDLPGGDYDTLIASIREKLLIMPDDTVVYSGHGPSTTIGRERASNPFLR